MRILGLGLLALAAGCSDGDTLYYLATTDGEVSGVAMRSQEGLQRDAQVGMNSVTCLLGIGTGAVNQEFDYSASDETVADVAWQAGRETVAVISPGFVHLQHNPSPSVAESTDVAVPGVRQVGLYDEGFVALTQTDDGCALAFHDGSDAEVPLEDCDVDLVTGSGADQTYVGADGGLDLVLPDGTVETLADVPSGLVAWDETADALYVAEPGDTVLHVLETDGSPRLSVDVGASIHALDAQAGVGRAVLSVADDASGAGGLVVIDGEDGTYVVNQYTPVAADEVASSLDGASFALVTPEAIHFYGMGSAWDAAGAAYETWEETRPRNPSD